MQKLTLPLLAAAIILINGCATLQGPNAPAIAATVKTAAYIGTHEALRSHPEWRIGFVEAHDALVLLEKQDVIDFTVLLAIVHQLPVNQLESPTAILVISAATILLDEGFNNPSVPLDTVKDLRPVARALREGIALGLGGIE